LPDYSPEPATSEEAITLRHKLNGISVPDAAVGGTTGNLCPGDENFIWSEWGNLNFANSADFNIQNQSDVADWPCFAKYYVTFPLDRLPDDKVIISATVTLHQFGGSGDPGQASPSLIQISLVNESWNETTLTWNNAPMAQENVSQAWADPVTGCGGTVPWPCFPRKWDVSRGTAMAYEAGMPLRLVFYEADSDYHSGKHFTSSNTGDWNAEGRPTLDIRLGDPTSMGVLEKNAEPTIGTNGSLITYSISWRGTGNDQNLVDQLPIGMSTPINLEATIGNISYSPSSQQIQWTGAPGLGAEVNLSYQVSVQLDGPTALINEARLMENNFLISSDQSIILIDPFEVNLPLIKK
jgi:hypothetical protein